MNSIETAENGEREGAEASPKSPPTPPPAAPTESSEARTETDRQIKANEIKALAETIKEISGQLDEEQIEHFLKNYFDENQEIRSLFDFDEPSTLAREVVAIERVIKGINQDKAKPERVDAVRESLLAMALSGRKICAETILSRLNGSIILSDNPGEEVDDHPNSENLAAFFRVADGRADIYLYDSCFNGGEDPDTHIRHEMGHLFAETGAIWELSQFDAFLDAVAEGGEAGDTKIAAIAEQAPELADIYRMIQNPQEAVFFRPYIKDKLNEISSVADEQKPDARRTAAREIIAEMTAFYLGSSDDEFSYFNARLQMVGGDTAELVKQVLDQGQLDLLKERFDVEGKKVSAQDIFEFIKDQPQFKADFQTQKNFLAKLNMVFANRGKEVKPLSETVSGEARAYADEEFGDYDALFTGAGGAISGGDHDRSTPGGGGNYGEGPLAALWSFFTGQRDTIKNPLEQ